MKRESIFMKMNKPKLLFKYQQIPPMRMYSAICQADLDSPPPPQFIHKIPKRRYHLTAYISYSYSLVLNVNIQLAIFYFVQVV